MGQSGISEINKSLVKRLVNTFKSNSGFREIKFLEQQANNNFYLASVSDKNGNYKVGINTIYPFYCGVKSLDNCETIEFCDLPKHITQLIPNEFTELQTDFLNEPLKPNHITDLNKVELKQIKYWKTEKIGNVIFNKYD